MARYRKRPVVVDAVPIRELDRDRASPGGTLMAGEPGDWLITGIKGECYPCKPDDLRSDLRGRLRMLEPKRIEVELDDRLSDLAGGIRIVSCSYLSGEREQHVRDGFTGRYTRAERGSPR